MVLIVSCTTFLSEANTWIQVSIKDIGQQVGHREDDYDHHSGCLNQRQVSPLNSEEEQAADAGEAKERFCDDEATDQPADADGHYGHCRQQGVPQHVTSDDPAAREA